MGRRGTISPSHNPETSLCFPARCIGHALAKYPHRLLAIAGAKMDFESHAGEHLTISMTLFILLSPFCLNFL
uniref:Uncharacterized protein n=1 Tax=Panagrellus redivivus TaxID=6233 RepID=A0A7E4UME6_PANRE